MDNKLPPMEIYTDGSCIHQNNSGKGPGGLGYVIQYWDMSDNVPTIKTQEGKRGFRMTTNNRMEIMAADAALKEVLDGTKTGRYNDIAEIRMFSDSKYLCDCVSNNWVAKWRQNNWKTSTGSFVKNRDLWEILMDTLKKISESNIRFSISHVQGHNGNPGNEAADRCAQDAAKDVENHEVDKIFEDLKGL